MTRTTKLFSIAAMAFLLLPIAACSSDDSQPVAAKRRPAPSSSGTNDGDGDDGTPTTPGGTTTPGGENTTPPTNDPGTTTPASTKGSGGPTGSTTTQTSTVGLSYMINAPAAPVKARGLLVLLHGSTASNYSTFVDRMANVATKHDLIRVSVLAPNGQGWNEGNQNSAAELLHRLLQEDLFKKYDILTNKIFFSGQSSGGGFLSTHFLPLHVKDYRGGAFMQCGAAKPSVALAPDAATKAGFKLHFEITTNDGIWTNSFPQSVSAYTAAGMTLTKDDTKPGGHCQFDQQQVIVDRIEAMLPK